MTGAVAGLVSSTGLGWPNRLLVVGFTADVAPPKAGNPLLGADVVVVVESVDAFGPVSPKIGAGVVDAGSFGAKREVG